MSTPLILSFMLALGSAFFAIPTVWADGGFRYGNTSAMLHHGRAPVGASGHMLRHFFAHQNEIGLSDEQITKLRTVALDADRAFIRASADRLVSERELRAMVRDPQVEMPAIEAKVKEAESLEATVRIIGIRAKRDLLAVLTPEQRAKLKTLRHGHRHYDRRPTQAESSRQSEVQDTELAPSAG